MNKIFYSSNLLTIFIYILLGIVLLTSFVGLFPLFSLILIIFLAYSMFQWLFSSYDNYKRKKEASFYDEHGSRKTKASIIEIREYDNKNTKGKKK